MPTSDPLRTYVIRVKCTYLLTYLLTLRQVRVNLTGELLCDWQADDTEGVHHSSGVRLQVIQSVQQESSRQSALTNSRRNLIAGTERFHSSSSHDWQVSSVHVIDNVHSNTMIHNYRNSVLCVWSKHSIDDIVKLLRCVCPSAFLWVLLCFIVHLVLLFFLSFTYTVYLSVCMSFIYVDRPCFLIYIKCWWWWW